MALLRQNKEIYYHKNNYECDFVVKKGNKINQAIQVCYEVNDKNKKRELNGIKEAIQEYKLDTGLIITSNQKETIRIENKTIEIIPAWEWLL